MARGHDFPLDYHRMLLDDFYRVDCYDRAIRQLVRPGDVVLDVGTGSGILALLAARRGARVHAVESMPVAKLARELAAANGLADRITVWEQDIVSMDPVEPVDLVLGEWMGRFLVDDRMLDAVEAAGRWLKPGGRISPSQIRLRIAPIADIAVHGVDLFRRPLLGLDLTPAIRYALNGSSPVELGPRALLANPVDWHVWSPPEVPPDFANSVRFEIARDAKVVGIAGFFSADLAPGITLSTAPGHSTHWGQSLFHLAPLQVHSGDELRVELSLLPGEDLDFQWSVEVWRAGRMVARDSRHTGREANLPAAPPVPADPVDPVAAHGTARALFKAGRVAAAAAVWERAVAWLRPEDDALAPEIYELLGAAYQHLGDPRAAIRALLRAIDGRPGTREKALRRLIDCARELGLGAERARWIGEYEVAFGRLPTATARGEAQVPRNDDRELSDDEETMAFYGSDPAEEAGPVDHAAWLIVLAGRSVGRMFRLEHGDLVIGRSPGCAVVVDDEGVSREHARLIVRADGYRIADLDSRNGTYVEDERIGMQPVVVSPGDRIRLGPGTIVKIGRADQLEQQVMVQLYHAATRDGLTGLFNKRFFFEALEQEVAWHKRHDQPLSLILGDIDMFKQVNTRFGHPTGDTVLAEVAARLQKVCRTEDLVARFGGEEFVLILRHTNREAASQLAERLRLQVSGAPILAGDTPIEVTASFGVATLAGAALQSAALLATADVCLRGAKAAGRNQVRTSP